MAVAARSFQGRKSQMTLVVLTEEESMQITLQNLLPRLGVNDFQIISFQGVSDLESSLARRVRAWRDPTARFLVIRDNDNGDCLRRKKRLLYFLDQAGTQRPFKVRIVLQELEAWFLGDLAALTKAGLLKDGRIRAKFRKNPEEHRKPEILLKELDRTYQKTSGAKRIAPHLSLSENTASSFHATLAAIRDLAESDGA